MNISDAMDILTKQRVFERTSKGRRITEEALSIIDASIDDKKNYGNNVIMCLNCGIILSSLLVPEGCVNCGSKDLTNDIKIS